MIYLDNHATTPCDPRVVESMLPWLTQHFANPHSTSHAMGREAEEAVNRSLESLSALVNAPATEMVITSGATESNNLAIKGVCLHPRQKRRHIITSHTEHPAVLDVCRSLIRHGFRVTELPVMQQGHPLAGQIDLDLLASTLDDDTALVSLMWANNEIGTIATMREAADLCHARGTLLHSDACQAVGRIPVDMRAADVDLLSASAHKFYGPKGVGLLAVGNGNRRVRILPEIIGGGQQGNRRSGTVAVHNVVAMSTALDIAMREMESQCTHVRELRDRLASRLFAAIDDLQLNGIPLESPLRLAGNLNIMLPIIEGEAWMAASPEIAMSSGAACSSVDPAPSHVLTSIGLTESQARQSVRFGIGRFNTVDEIDRASEILIDAFHRIAKFA